MKILTKKDSTFRVLVAPLDWGLGHATRCIPIIKALVEQKAEVFIAAEGTIALIIQQEFPFLNILPLKGYRIRYSSRPKYLIPGLLLQLPRILLVIAHERKWLKKIIAEKKIDAVISDNRFGLYSTTAWCIYITHQLSIDTGNVFINRLAQMFHYRYINRFDEVWVPDSKGEPNLAGMLSHPKRFPTVPVKYMGILSRFKFEQNNKNIDLLIILSGPEPQRTIFESLLLNQIKGKSFSITLIRGLPGKKEELKIENDIVIYDHLPASALNRLIQQSHLVLARCGYSTIMDLAVIQQKAILVPTPGQTEQEYLGNYLQSQHYFFVSKQQQFSLENVLKAVERFDFSLLKIDRFNTAALNELMKDCLEAL